MVSNKIYYASTSNNPYPFGSSINTRSFSAGSGFRFGFNTQEKDKEIYNNNETYTATFWEYDGRLGRRWNLDPKPISSLSSYNTFANNPNLFKDVFGDVFKIGKNDLVAKEDVKSIVKPKNQKYVKFTDDGEVKIDFNGLSQKKIDKILKRDRGLSLINDLSNAKNSKGDDLNFFYGTEGITNIGLENPPLQTDVYNYYSNISTLDNKGGEFADKFRGFEEIRAFVLNASTQQYSDQPNEYGLKPLDNYDGKVFIARGQFINIIAIDIKNGITSPYDVIPRSSILYHELRESLLRTALGYCYDRAHNEAGGTGDGVSRFYPETN